MVAGEAGNDLQLTVASVEASFPTLENRCYRSNPGDVRTG
jgi:hypothetical protein